MSAPKGADSERLAVRRQLKIKGGATRRLLKEHRLYRKEAEEQERKVGRIAAENGEEWDIKNATRIFEESQRMIQDSGDRLQKAVQDLNTLVDSVKSRPDLSSQHSVNSGPDLSQDDNDLLDAQNLLTEASAELSRVQATTP